MGAIIGVSHNDDFMIACRLISISAPIPVPKAVIMVRISSLARCDLILPFHLKFSPQGVNESDRPVADYAAESPSTINNSLVPGHG